MFLLFLLRNFTFYDESSSEGSAKEEEETKEEVEEEEGEQEEEQEEETVDPAVEKQEQLDKETKEMLEKDAEEDKEDVADLLGVEKPKEEEEKETEESEEKKEDEALEGEEEEGEKEEEKKEEGEEEEEDPLLKELGRLGEMAAGIEQPPKEEKKDVKEEEGKEEESKEEKKDALGEILDIAKQELDTDEVEYIGAEDFKESLTPDEVPKLNKALNSLAQKVAQEARKIAIQDGMAVFPNMMDYKIKGFMAANEFWNNNPDISALCEKYPKVKSWVSLRAQDIQNKNPKMTLKQVYNKTQEEVRALLGKERLDKFKADRDTKPTGKDPAKGSLARKRTGGKTVIAPPKSPTEMSDKEQIADLIDYGKLR